MKKKKKDQNENTCYDWDDRPIDTNSVLTEMSEKEISERYEKLFDKPYEPDPKQIIDIRTVMPHYLWKVYPDRRLKDLTEYTVILYMPQSCEDEMMERTAEDLLLRNCRDFARCSVQNDEWRYVIEKKYTEMYGEVDHRLNIWTIESADAIEDTLWICKDRVLAMCYDGNAVEDFCGHMKVSRDLFAEMEKQMEMTWGAWQLQHDIMLSWHTEADWWGDPFRKISRNLSDYLDYHDCEWIQYILESKLKELNEKHRKVKVLGVYQNDKHGFLICEKFPDGIVREYLHTGYNAYMHIDGEHEHGFIVYQNKPEDVYEDIRSWDTMPDEFTLVSLNTKYTWENLADIKTIYFMRDT